MSIYRTHTCNEISLDDVGKHVKVAGFVETIRDFGGLVLLTLLQEFQLSLVFLLKVR